MERFFKRSLTTQRSDHARWNHTDRGPRSCGTSGTLSTLCKSSSPKVWIWSRDGIPRVWQRLHKTVHIKSLFRARSHQCQTSGELVIVTQRFQGLRQHPFGSLENLDKNGETQNRHAPVLPVFLFSRFRCFEWPLFGRLGVWKDTGWDGS